MEENKTRLKVEAEVDLDSLADNVSYYADDDQVLDFLAALDEKMGSWDFTLKAAQFFIVAALKMTEQPGRPMETGALARVGEFLRQAAKQPHVVSGQPIMGMWTDPEADFASLDAGDLNMVIDLAAMGLRSLPAVVEV